MAKIFVTGANGFVGRALCPAFGAAGHDVVMGVRNAALIGGGNVHEVPDIGPTTDWQGAHTDVDVVVHLAARVHIMNDTSDDPLEKFRNVNTEGTRHLAETAAAAGVKRFVYLSSIKVNGEATDDEPFSEKDIPDPQDAYGQSKWEAEQALWEISRRTGLEVVILRPPLVYGPYVKGNFFSLLALCQKNPPLPLGLTGNKRSLIFLGNLVDAIIACAIHEKAAGKTFLVSDGEDVSTTELIRKITAALAKPSRLFPVPPSWLRFAGSMLGKEAAIERLLGNLQVDDSAIRRELGWRPPYSMEDGLRDTAAWYQGRSIA